MKTKNTKPSQLELNIEGTNELNKFSIESLKNVLPKITALKGVSILLKDGKTGKKFNIERGNQSTQLKDKYISSQYWFDISEYSIWLKVKICINGGSWELKPPTAYCNYFENSIYIASMKDGAINETVELETIIKNFDLDKTINIKESLKQVEQYKELKKKADELYNSIPEYVKKAEYLKNY